jgi:hypothetical protein
MRISVARIAWILSAVLVVLGAVLTPLFPEPFVTFFCSNSVCSTTTSGGIPLGLVVIALGVFVAAIAGIISLVTVAAQRLPR